MSTNQNNSIVASKALTDAANRPPVKKRAQNHNNGKGRRRGRKKPKSSNCSDNQHALGSTTTTAMSMKSHYNDHDDDDNNENQSSVSAWLDELELSIPDLSLVPMSAASIVKRLEQSMNRVQTQYVPLVRFLVHCQEALENTKRVKDMKPQKCHKEYIAPLSQVFPAMPLSMEMDAKELTKAKSELVEVCNNAKQGDDWTEMKQLFIGRMVGHSSGLYGWVSELGHARSICCDVECILQACCKLDPTLYTTRELAQLLRSVAKKTLDHLMQNVPNKYHLQSTLLNKYPPPPYFHRLEAAVRGMATFDPTDDDIVCVADPKITTQAACGAPAISCDDDDNNNSNNNQDIISIDDTDDEVIEKKSDDGSDAKKKSEPEVICIDDSDDDDSDEMRWI